MSAHVNATDAFDIIENRNNNEILLNKKFFPFITIILFDIIYFKTILFKIITSIA
jgi:hypothetical protein